VKRDDRSLILQELNEEAAIDYDPVAGTQAFGDLIAVTYARTQSHMPPRETVVGLRDIDEGQIFIVAQHR
jgi:hypothetical protein